MVICGRQRRRNAEAGRRTGKDVGGNLQCLCGKGADEDTIRTYFDEERILTAQEAIDAGLATGILEPMKAVAKFNKGIKSPNKSEEMDKSKFDQLIEAV